MQTIAVFNTRGGSGKSAATVFLADFLGTVFKKRVLVVDLDPQQSSSIALVGEERLYEAFGRKKSLPLLLRRVAKEDVRPNAILHSAIDRPQKRGGRKGTVYLAPLHVFACERESWHNLDSDLSKLSQTRQQASYRMLPKLLEPISSEFDICLIDFPGHETGPIAKSGLRAAHWWLFPCLPERSGTRDIEAPIAAIEDAYKGTKRTLRGLGTLLSISQPASSTEYKQAYQMLKHASEKNIIPRLFSNNAKLLYWTGAKTSLDDTRWDESTTLAAKYKEKALNKAVRALCRETLQRIDMPADEVKLNFGMLDGLNSMLRKVFIGAKT